MSSNAFKKDELSRPARYRTPSPPRYAFEPLSPRSTSESYPPAIEAWNVTARVGREHVRRQEQIDHGYIHGLGRSSVMDAFASIALAANSSPRACGNTHSTEGLAGNTVLSRDNTRQRPSKRARSEKLPSPELHRPKSRPVTGYSPASDVSQGEAELLLNFSQGARLRKPSSAHPYPFPSSPPGCEAGKEQDRSFPLASVSKRKYSSGEETPKDVHESVSLRESLLRDDSVQDETQRWGGSVDLSPSSQPTPGLSSALIQDKGLFQNEQNTFEFHKALITPASNEYSGTTAASSEKHDSVSKQVTYTQTAEYSNKEAIRPSNGEGEKIEPAAVQKHVEAAVPLPSTDPTNSATNVKKPRQAMEPAVCALCNFNRNTLTSETEDNTTSWIKCDACKSWFHFACAGFKNEREVRGVDKYRCRKCRPSYGPTTYVRKSSRAHSAIDYAGLHEGVLKTSDENPEHHYIKPIKEGIIKFQPEKFARMHPELVTAEYFLRGEGMKEPILIPATLNPRPEDEHRLDHDDYAKDSKLGDHDILENWLSQNFQCESVLDHGQDALDMVMPANLTVRKVSELYGPEEPVEVIDVKSQNGEDRRWTMKRWVDYYESNGNKKVRNVISLEVSMSKLGRLIRRPKIVRDLDLQDSVWPQDPLAKKDFPKVQFYCLMSVADCFTDFHIDFGGSSVFYHILKGKKTFFFIPPTEKNLKKYEEWCMSPAQNWTFLGDQTKECYRVDLSQGDTMLIPAGWIHAVWTPEDSLVIGGNFLTRMHYGMQIRIAQIEKATGVARKFRYPHFQKLLWYTALQYLEVDPVPTSVMEALTNGQVFGREKSTHHEFVPSQEASGSEKYHARYYSQPELDGLPDLGRYLLRTALIAIGSITEGITVETRNAVKRSIPRGHFEPLDVVKKFAMWCAWKRGNEPLPHWAYPDYIPEGGAPESAEKKLSAAAVKRLDREAALQAFRAAPERHSTRQRSSLHNNPLQDEKGDPSSTGADDMAAVPETKSDSLGPQGVSNLTPEDSATTKRVSSGSSRPYSRRPACETCRKRRRACKHRDEGLTLTPVANTKSNRPGAVATDIPTEEVQSEPSSGSRPAEDEIKPPTHHHQALEHHISGERETLPLGQISRFLHVEIPQGKGKTQESFQIEENLLGTQTLVPATPPEKKDLSSKISTSAKSHSKSKACKDCRRSKRRCVHDANGNEDPIKLLEGAIPRPSATFKGRKAKAEAAERDVPGPSIVNEEASAQAPIHSQQAVIQESLASAIGDELNKAPITPLTAVDKRPLNDMGSEVSRNASQYLFNADEEEVQLIATSSPLSEAPYEIPHVSNPAATPFAKEKAPHANRPKFYDPSAETSLVSPPASTHTNEGNESNEGEAENRNSSPVVSAITPTISSSSRHSSRTIKQVQRYTPESGPTRHASSSTTGEIRTTGVRESKSTSPPVTENGVTTENMGLDVSMNNGKRKRAEAGSNAKLQENMNAEEKLPGSMIEPNVDADAYADEESLKLIRELQAQDMGLRKRRRGAVA